jgi:exodeoxyribonuclease VII large subunit
MDRRFFHQPKEIFSPHVQRLDDLYARLLRGLEQRLVSHQQRLQDKIHRLFQASPEKHIQHMKENRAMLEKRMLHIIQSQLRFNKERFEGILKNMNAINPLAILERGYSICSKNEKSLKNTEGVSPGDRVQVRLFRGGLDCTVKKIIEES